MESHLVLPAGHRSAGPFCVEVKGMFTFNQTGLSYGPGGYRPGATVAACPLAGN
jgi:hypothetical protein